MGVTPMELYFLSGVVSWVVTVVTYHLALTSNPIREVVINTFATYTLGPPKTHGKNEGLKNQ